MGSASQTFRQAANSSVGREARDAAKSAAETAKNIGEDVSDFASDVSRRAGREFDRARGAAGDVWDEVHDATVRNPHLSLAIALGIGFLFGVVVAGRR
jgi:ElaB/YqjD/DUF883 family membrane-anchored ribosome-binding protein